MRNTFTNETFFRAHPPAGARASRRTGKRLSRSKNAFSLVEVMVSFGIFAVVATGVMGSLLYSRKMAETNLSQAYAQATAQGLLEEVIRLPPAVLADSAETAVTVKIAALTANNKTAMTDFSLPWHTAPDTYTILGTSTEGVLMDAAYIASSQAIRAERYMQMRINLQRELEPDEHRVRITLRYLWEVPNRRKSDGTPVYLSGEVRTFRSMALRF